MKRHTEVIGFRLPKELLPLLDEERKRRGLSRGDLCRALVISLLMRPEVEAAAGNPLEELTELRESVGELQAELQKLQAGLARGVCALLMQSGMEPEAAKTFVREKLMPRAS